MEEENKTKLPPVKNDGPYTMKHLETLAQKDRYSGFGPMPLSEHHTEPHIGFGKSTRQKREKVYQTKENMKAFLGMATKTHQRQELTEHVHRHRQVRLSGPSQVGVCQGRSKHV